MMPEKSYAGAIQKGTLMDVMESDPGLHMGHRVAGVDPRTMKVRYVQAGGAVLLSNMPEVMLLRGSFRR